MPRSRSPSASAPAMPSTTVVERRCPRSVCVCGSKKISAWRTPCAAARSEVRRASGRRSPLGHEHRAARVVDVEERLQIVEHVRAAARPRRRRTAASTPLRPASSNISSGSSVPSMCRCSSALGSPRTKAASGAVRRRLRAGADRRRRRRRRRPWWHPARAAGGTAASRGGGRGSLSAPTSVRRPVGVRHVQHLDIALVGTVADRPEHRPGRAAALAHGGDGGGLHVDGHDAVSRPSAPGGCRRR